MFTAQSKTTRLKKESRGGGVKGNETQVTVKKKSIIEADPQEVQTVELPDTDLKITVIKMLKELEDKMVTGIKWTFYS